MGGIDHLSLDPDLPKDFEHIYKLHAKSSKKLESTLLIPKDLLLNDLLPQFINYVHCVPAIDN